MTKIKALVDTTLKPWPEQSAKLTEDGHADQMRVIKAGTELEIIWHEADGSHLYLVLAEPVGAIASKGGKNPAPGQPGFSRGFVYGPSVELIEDAKALSDDAGAAAYPDDWRLSMDFPSRVVRYCMDKGYSLASGLRERNIIYIEGVDRYGKPNADRPNEWNDQRILLSFDEARAPYFVNSRFPMSATTEPGDKYTYSPMNDKGAFRIAFGEHKSAWYIDTHGRDAHSALRQIGPITGHRDKNKDFSRTGDALDTGLFAVNQHGPYTYNGRVGISSAGCLVAERMDDHLEFMRLLKLDPRYLRDRNFRFGTIIIDGDDFAKSKWGY